MTSSLFEGLVAHQRRGPQRHSFTYRLFFFHLDLDDLDALDRDLRLFSRNRRNLYSFRDADHFPGRRETTRANVIDYLRENGIEEEIGRISLVAHVRTLGYVFNPVAFYFCSAIDGRSICAVCEVTNTFGERKRFLLPAPATGDRFEETMDKFFYVSPFVDLDAKFVFRLAVPDEKMELHIDSHKDGQPVVLSTLSGRRKPLSDLRLAANLFRYPLMTLRVTFAIHWQALRLWIKGIPYHRKAANPALQRDLVDLPSKDSPVSPARRRSA